MPSPWTADRRLDSGPHRSFLQNHHGKACAGASGHGVMGPEIRETPMVRRGPRSRVLAELLLALAAGCAGAPGEGRGQPLDPLARTERYTLPNGLVLLVKED